MTSIGTQMIDLMDLWSLLPGFFLNFYTIIPSKPTERIRDLGIKIGLYKSQ